MAANTLTYLIRTIYEAKDIVCRELAGMIMAVNRDATAAKAAVGQTVRSPVVPVISPQAITYTSLVPDEGEQIMGYTDITLSNAYQAPIKWNGEEQISLGDLYPALVRDQFTQAFRAIVNMIEEDLCQLYSYASRAYGAAGTTPFASDYATTTAQIKKILDDNGMPMADRHLVIDTAAGANLRSLTGLNTVYAAGTDATLRQGLLLPLNGFDIRESAQIQSHTKGTMTGEDCTAVEVIGETSIAVDGGDAGTVLAGDVIKNTTKYDAGIDLSQYVVSNDTQTASGVGSSGNIIINKPGLMVATAITNELTIQNTHKCNMAFHRQAIQLACRVPALPQGGDGAADVLEISDPLTGLTFQVLMYRLHRMVKFEIGMVWGVGVNKTEGLALLLG